MVIGVAPKARLHPATAVMLHENARSGFAHCNADGLPRVDRKRPREIDLRNTLGNPPDCPSTTERDPLSETTAQGTTERDLVVQVL